MSEESRKENEAITHFGNEIDKLVERFRMEYEIAYASVIGVLFTKAHIMVNEAMDRSDEVSS